MRGMLTSTEIRYSLAIMIVTFLCALIIPVYVAWDISNTIGNLALRITEIEAQHEAEKAKAKMEKAKPVEVSRSYTRTRTENFLVTAYSTDPRECARQPEDKDYGRTASGYKLQASDSWRHVAVDNTRFKFGTRFIIHAPQGDIHAIASDTGSAINGNRLDLFVGVVTRAEIERRKQTGQEPAAVLEALKWGVKKLRVTILD